MGGPRTTVVIQALGFFYPRVSLSSFHRAAAPNRYPNLLRRRMVSYVLRSADDPVGRMCILTGFRQNCS